MSKCEVICSLVEIKKPEDDKQGDQLQLLQCLALIDAIEMSEAWLSEKLVLTWS